MSDVCVGFNWIAAANISETKTYVHSGDALINSAKLLGISGLIVMGLIGCASPAVLQTTLTEEKVPERMMKVSDFSFPVEDNDLFYVMYQVENWDPLLQQDKCGENLVARDLIGGADVVDEISFWDAGNSGDGDSYLAYLERVLKFDSEEQASQLVEVITEGAEENPVCLDDWETWGKSFKLVAKGTSQDVFGLGADNSYAYIRDSKEGGQEWRRYLAAVAIKDMVLIIEAGVDAKGPGLDFGSMQDSVIEGIEKMIE
jgi:hypothetical protein